VRAADGAVSASKFNAEQVRERYGIRPRVVYNGVDLSLFTPEERADGEVLARLGLESSTREKPAILYAGRMIRWKGVEYLIKALPDIEPEGTVLWLAGEGEYRPVLERMAGELGVRHKVRFLGKVEQKDLAALYRQGVGLVATSFVNETFGMALCEAMACGTPVVASNFGGFREVVLDGVSGFLTRPQDPHDISLKVNMLLADLGRAKKMGEAGRRFVVENFSWKAVADRVEEAYREVVRGED
jgi:glycosyltransferase involved in cell wall biosynthesis